MLSEPEDHQTLKVSRLWKT